MDKQAILALCSGTLALVVFGSIYTFGALTPYISSYLYYQKDDTSSTAMSVLFTLTIITISVGVAISSIFLSKFSNRILCIMAIIGMSASVFVASFMKTFAGYAFFYGFCYGLSIGIGYFPPLKNCYLHLPKKKGLCAGICMSGFGLGSALFNFVIVSLVNPDDVSLDSITKKYPESVANNLPIALRILAGIYLAMGLLGSVFIMPPKQKKQQLNESIVSDHNDANEISEAPDNQKKPLTQSPEEPSFSSMIKVLKQKKAYFLIAQFACIAPFGMFTAFNYKRIAFQRNSYFLENDHLITTIGSVGIICNGLFRSAWGILFDYFSYRKIIITINVFLLAFCALILVAVENVVTYFMIIPGIYLSYGGLYAILPTQSVRVLGPVVGSKLFWLIFCGFTGAAVIQFTVQYFFLTYMGSEGYYYCLGTFFVLEIIGLIISITVHYEYEESENHLAKKTQVDEKDPQQITVK